MMSDPFITPLTLLQPPKPSGPEKEICHINKGIIYQCEWKVLNAGNCVSAIGQGSTMKEAQQGATKNLLNRLKAENNLTLQGQQTNQNQIKYPQPHKIYEILNGYGEPVSKLYLISHLLQNVTGPPEFLETGNEGPPHQKKFTTRASFDGMVEHGSGNNKRNAKQSAAGKILNNIFQKIESEKGLRSRNPDPVIKSLINDIQTQAKGNGHEVQTQTDPPTSDKDSCDIQHKQTQTKNGKIDQIGPIYDSDSDSDCENSNLLGYNDSMNNESIKNEPESGEPIESEDEEEEEKEMKGFDFDSLFNDQPSTSVFSEMPKYSRTGVVHEEKSQIFQDLLSKMSEEDRYRVVQQENDNFIKRKRPMDDDDLDANTTKKRKMLNFVPGNASHSHYNKAELNSTTSTSRANANELDDDIDQMVNMDKIKYGVGSQLMLKMGFTPGEGLGKNKQGIKVPIKPQSSFANTNYKNRPGKGQRGWIP